MTYAEKLKQLRDLSNEKLAEFQFLSDRYKMIVDRGRALSAEQSEQRYYKFREYQDIFASYYDLWAHIGRKKIKMNEKFVGK